MLTTAHPVTEVVQHVYNVLANETCRHILQEIGILEEMDNHLYINSTLHNPSKSWDQNLNPILVEDRFVCTYDIRHASLGLTWDTTNVQQHTDSFLHKRYRNYKSPILEDRLHHITLSDTVLPFNIPMNCSMTFRDHARAHEIIDRMHLRFNHGEYVSVANLSYDYPLPLRIVQALWALASTIGIEKKCFPAWMSQFSNGMIRKIVAEGLVSDKAEWVVKRQVFETLIKIDYDPGNEPEGQGENNAESYAVRFNMTLHASRPSVLYLDYPIIVANTLVPESIITADTSYQNQLYKFLANPVYDIDMEYQQSKFLIPKPVQNPWYDDWQVPTFGTLHTHLKTMPFFIGAFTLDEPDCRNCPCKSDGPPPNPYDQGPYSPPTPYGEGTPYEWKACLHHSWLARRSVHFHHDCNDCPYHKRTPQEEPCPCFCRSKATTDLNLDTDLDRYRLSPIVREYYRERKEKALELASVYNISVFVDDVQMDKSLITFDGTVVHVSNALGPNHIYRLVLSRTPPRHVDSSMKDVQGPDPYHPCRPSVYRHPFFQILDCIIVPKHTGATYANGQECGKPPAPEPRRP